MSKYDADKIFRNLSSVNKITEPMGRLNKKFVNYDELLDIPKLFGGALQPDREFIALECEPITPTRGRIVNTTYNIDSKNVQIGDHNTQNVTINIQKLVEAIAESNDNEAKNMLKSLLENSTVASVVGAGVSGLIAHLT